MRRGLGLWYICSIGHIRHHVAALESMAGHSPFHAFVRLRTETIFYPHASSTFSPASCPPAYPPARHQALPPSRPAMIGIWQNVSSCSCSLLLLWTMADSLGLEASEGPRRLLLRKATVLLLLLLLLWVAAGLLWIACLHRGHAVPGLRLLRIAKASLPESWTTGQSADEDCLCLVKSPQAESRVPTS